MDLANDTNQGFFAPESWLLGVHQQEGREQKGSGYCPWVFGKLAGCVWVVTMGV